MTTQELIDKLEELDPKGKCEVYVGTYGDLVRAKSVTIDEDGDILIDGRE